MLRLRVKIAPDQAFEWRADAPRIRVGRAATCDLRFEGSAAKFVSGEHLEISFGPAGLIATDLGSSNGVFLNETRLQGSLPIGVGTLLGLGRTGPVLEVVEFSHPPVDPLPQAIPMGVAVAAPAQPMQETPAAWLAEGSEGEPATPYLPDAEHDAQDERPRRGNRRRPGQASSGGMRTYSITVLVVGAIGLALILWIRANHWRIQLIDEDQIQEGAPPAARPGSQPPRAGSPRAK